MGSYGSADEINQDAQDDQEAPRFYIQDIYRVARHDPLPSRDGGPWDQAIRLQDLAIALQQRYVAGKDSFELVLTASKKAIPGNIGALRNHEIVMTNFLGLFERATFSPEGSAHDKHLEAWIENMQKVGSEALFPNSTTTANVNEVKRLQGPS